MRNIRPQNTPAYKTNEWVGLSTDNKDSIKEQLLDGDLFRQMDDGKVFRYSKEKNEWYNEPTASGGGGTGGTDSYTKLNNLPKINGHVIVGEEVGASYGLVDKTTLDTELAKKQDKISAGKNIEISGNVIKNTVIDDTTEYTTDKTMSTSKIKTWVQGDKTIDYTKLDKIPTIEGTAVNGDKTAGDFGLAKKVDVDKKQDKLTAGNGITISADSKIAVDIIDDTLSTSSTKTMSIDGIKKFIGAPMKYVGTVATMNDLGSSEKDVGYVYTVLDEKRNYAYTKSKNWVSIGTTDIDLSSYYTKAQTDTAIDDKISTHNSDANAHAAIREDVAKRVPIDGKASADDIAQGKLNKWVDSNGLKTETDKLVKKSNAATMDDVTAGNSDKWMGANIGKEFFNKFVLVDGKATQDDVSSAKSDKWVDSFVLSKKLEAKQDKITANNVLVRDAKTGNIEGRTIATEIVESGNGLATAGAVYSAIPHLYEHNIAANPTGKPSFAMRFYSTDETAINFTSLLTWIKARGVGIRIPVTGGTYPPEKTTGAVTITHLYVGNGTVGLIGTCEVLSSTAGQYANRYSGYGWTVSDTDWKAFDSDGKSKMTDTVIKIF